MHRCSERRSMHSASVSAASAASTSAFPKKPNFILKKTIRINIKKLQLALENMAPTVDASLQDMESFVKFYMDIGQVCGGW